ncbi:MAG: tetratricopeptide repeat protein, partial [Gammaproteobacteria bacterium]
MSATIRRLLFSLILIQFSHLAFANAMDNAMLAIRTRDFAQAVHLLYPVARAGNKEAQYQLGILIRNGQGARQNLKAAADWLRLASKQGLARAQYALGIMYLNGEGVDENDTRARFWLEKAAKQG